MASREEEEVAYARELREQKEDLAAKTLRYYEKITHETVAEEGFETVAGDLIADLLHLARRRDIDAEALLGRSSTSTPRSRSGG